MNFMSYTGNLIMKNANLNSEIIQILADVLEIDSQTITPSFSFEDCDSWESMNHMHLILALEQTYSIKIPDESAIDLLSLQDIVNYIKKEK